MSRDSITKEEFEELVLDFKEDNPHLPEKEIREDLSFYFIVKSDKENEIRNMIDRISINMSINNRLLKELLEYPFDLSEENKSRVDELISSSDIKTFNKLVNMLDNRNSRNKPDVIYHKYEPQSDKKSISTRITVGANPCIDIVTKSRRCLFGVPVFI